MRKEHVLLGKKICDYKDAQRCMGSCVCMYTGRRENGLIRQK